MESSTALLELSKINSAIKRLLASTSEYEFGSDIEYDESPNGSMLRNKLRILLENLEECHRKIDYLLKPITKEGQLTSNSAGQFELDEHEFTSGSIIELLLYDDYL